MESEKPLFMKKPVIIVAVVIVLVIVGIAVMSAMGGRSGGQKASTGAVTDGEQSVATDGALQSSLDALKTDLKQAATDREAAAAVLDASKKTVTIDTGSGVTVQQIKQAATAEIYRRVTNLKKAQDILATDVALDNPALNVTSSADSKTIVAVQKSVKDKMRETVKTTIAALDTLKQQVANSTKLNDTQTLATTINNRFASDQLLYAQASTTKSVETITVVFDTLKTVRNDLQKQITALQSSQKDTADSLQTQLDNTTGLLTTLQSNVASAVALLSMLSTTLGTLPAGPTAANLQSSYGAIVSQLEGIRMLAATAHDMLQAIVKTF